MSNKELLEKLIKDVADLRQEVGLLREDMDVVDQVVGGIADLREQLILTNKNDNNAKKELKQEMQWMGDKVAIKVENKVERIEDIIEDRKVVHVKRPLFGWFKRKR